MEIGVTGLAVSLAAGAIGALLGRRSMTATSPVPPRADVAACTTFDLSLPYMRFRKSSGLDLVEARCVEREFRRYFTLVAMCPGASLGMRSEAVDAFWHEVILCTSLYRDFCAATAGRFVDHDPMAGDDDSYARTWGAYVHVFEEEPDPAIWPDPDPDALGRLRISTPHAGSRDARHSILLVVSLGSADGSPDGGDSGGDSGGDGGGCGSE